MAINPLIPTEGLFKLLTLPQYGYLVNGKTRLQIGSKFSQQDIFEERIRFVSTINVPNDEEFLEDSFKFSLYKYGLGNITASSYNDCMPDQQIPTPEDGIFEFKIRINKLSEPTVELAVNKIDLVANSFYPINSVVLNSTLEGVSPNNIVHKLLEPTRNGYVSIKGKKVNSFTQADVNAGNVRYVAGDLGNVFDRIEFQTCTRTAVCVGPTVIDVEIHNEFKQIGDNVIYAVVDSVFTWDFQTNTDNALWSLNYGTSNPPKNAGTPSTNIIEWSNYALVAGQPTDDPERGAGFNVLNQYKNTTEEFFWDGGLPTGVAVSNVGYVGTQFRIPLSQAGTQPWKLPIEPGRFLFTVTAIDPVTGFSVARRYALITNYTGTNQEGLQSETQVL